MLEKYFVKPQTVDRVRACWIGAEIERYVEWLCGREYAARTVWHRVPILVEFGEFARVHGANVLEDLPVHVDGFVARWAARQQRAHRRGEHDRVGREVRGPIEQMLCVAVPGFNGSGRPHRRAPFLDVAPGFFEYLATERGLRPVSIRAYQHHLDRFEDYLTHIGVKELPEVSPTVLAAFVAERRAAGLAKTTVRQSCGVLRVFLRYAHREGVLGRDLSDTVQWPQVYRLSDVPRSISWAEVERVLAGVDRRTPCGKRDYAILLLLVSYGLRGREIAALTLDDIDWKRSGWPSRNARPGIRRRSRCPRWWVRRWSTIYDTLDRTAATGTCSSARWRRSSRSRRPRCVPAPAITCLRRVSRCPARGRTRCAIPVCNVWWTPISR